MKKFITLLFVLNLFVNAQDRHFWDQAVGGRTALLGGIAVGGVRDYSATFYDPGALSFLSKNSMNFNFNMYGIKDFKFIDGGGPGIDSRYTRVSLYPASLAGPLPFLGDSLNRFSYMIYSTGYSYVRVSERFEGYADVIPTRPPSQPGFPNAFQGDEYLINQGKIDVLLSEVSVGFGYSKKIADNVGIGLPAEQWLYTPAIQRDRRVAPQEKSQRFMGTDFTHDDIEERSVEDYDYELLGEENFAGQPAWKIRSAYKDRGNTQYSQLYLWVRKDHLSITYIEFYVDGKLRKTLRWDGWKQIQGIWTPLLAEMKDLSKTRSPASDPLR